MDRSISVEGVNIPNKPLTNFQLIDTVVKMTKRVKVRGEMKIVRNSNK